MGGIGDPFELPVVDRGLESGGIVGEGHFQGGVVVSEVAQPPPKLLRQVSLPAVAEGRVDDRLLVDVESDRDRVECEGASGHDHRDRRFDEFLLHVPDALDGLELAQPTQLDRVDGDVAQDLRSVRQSIDAEQKHEAAHDRTDGDD